jgi:hypothetical protein
MAEDDKKPKPTPSPTPGGKALTPSQAADKVSSEAKNAVATVPGTGRKGTGLTGAPLGTPVLKGERTITGVLKEGVGSIPSYGYTQYKAGDGAVYFSSLNNQERIDLLVKLAQIPGLYAKNKAPTRDYLLGQAATKQIPIRPEDIDALEKVMTYADTVGDDVRISVNRLVQQPTLAQGFFDIAGTIEKTKKIRLTPAEALAVEYEQSVRDYLDVKPTKKELNDYAKRVNELETKRKGPLTSLERQQILIDSVQEKAKTLFGDAGPDSNVMRRGALGGTYNLLKRTYADYGVAVDEKTLAKQSINSIRSKQALENTLSKIALQAEVSMPALSSYIQQGLTPREALGNYIGAYSKIYGVPEEQVNLEKLAPVWSGDKLMPYQDWQKYLYTLPEFENTELFRQQKISDARTLYRNFIG